MNLELRLVPVLVTIDRNKFKMRVWKLGMNGYKRGALFSIAVGAIGYATPAGMYFVSGKSRTPDWLAPDSEWVAEEDRGKIFPIEDPKNPFDGGFISLGNTDGVGIHGTKFDPRLGERVSHGCIRMAVPDFLKIYDQLPTGTPVFIY